MLTRWRPGTWVALLVIVLVYWLIAGRIIAVPLTGWQPTVPVDPLLPCTWAVVAGLLFDHPMPEIEEVVRRRVIAARAIWFGMVLTCGSVLSVLGGLVFATSTPLEGVRSWLAFFGLAVICGELFGAGLSWFLPTLLAVATIFLGKNAADLPRAWAWLLHEENALPSHLVSAIIALLAGVLYASSRRLRMSIG